MIFKLLVPFLSVSFIANLLVLHECTILTNSVTLVAALGITAIRIQSLNHKILPAYEFIILFIVLEFTQIAATVVIYRRRGSIDVDEAESTDYLHT